MIAVLFALFLGTAISFAGSVQLGPVNFGTLHTALNKHKNAAILFGLGGSLPELLYCGLAFASTDLLSQLGNFQASLKYLTSGILFVFGLVLIFQKASESSKKYKLKDGNEVWVGATFGLLNPQLYPFWLIIITNLQSNNIHHFSTAAAQVAFTIGAALGAFILQYLVAVFAAKKREYIYLRLTKNYNKMLGAIMILVAIIQLVINS